MIDRSRNAVIREDSVDFPGAQAPDRSYRVDAAGVGIAVHEWGERHAPPLLAIHGGFDFARTLDVFAPLVAAGGWRVVSWDHRNHGDSELVAMHGFAADLRDAAWVLKSLTDGPVPVLGHSKGGALSLRLADSWPHRVSHLINIDGMPARRKMPDVSDTERTKLLSTELAGWLDHHRRASTGQRKSDTLEGLARRRAKMNPRLTHEWLCYLVTAGARHDPDGWRWKIDPMMRMGGFGPWRPDWAIEGLAGLAMPFLGIVGDQSEPMGWEASEEELRPFVPRHARLETVAGTGHFVHIEEPDKVAALVLEFLGRPPSGAALARVAAAS